MPTLQHIQKRLAELKNNNPITAQVISILEQQAFRAELDKQTVDQLCEQFKVNPIELALNCVPVSACYALVPVSKFFVGAVAIGQSGTFYFGANLEFTADAMGQTVHAEQSAISHAWLAGEKAITDVVVNYTPCGHCRQFMNELNTAQELKIHLPHSQNNLLQSYLPDSFGPKDLNISQVLFDPQPHKFVAKGDRLQQAAIEGLNDAYAPYSETLSSVALQVGEQIIIGRYAENAAFNPSFLPLQGALNYRRMLGLSDVPVNRIVMAEQKGILSHRVMTQSLAQHYFGLDVEYIEMSV